MVIPFTLFKIFSLFRMFLKDGEDALMVLIYPIKRVTNVTTIAKHATKNLPFAQTVSFLKYMISKTVFNVVSPLLSVLLVQIKPYVLNVI